MEMVSEYGLSQNLAYRGGTVGLAEEVPKVVFGQQVEQRAVVARELRACLMRR